MASNEAQQAPEAQKQVTHMNPRIEKDRQMILDAGKKGKGSLFKVFVKLSGPGWLQSAITIGGGSLSNSLYLGVLVGFACMWVQPLAMILGVVMLGAIAYVTLSSGEPPLRAINKHVSPILGWGWLIGSMLANLVWSMPQYAVSAGALQQNLFPRFFGWEEHVGVFGSVKGGTTAAAVIVLAIALCNVMLYNKGGKAAKVFETIIKVIIGMIVICFFGVIIKLSLVKDSNLDWGRVLAGFIPNIRLFTQPAVGIAAEIAKVDAAFQSFWSNLVVGFQRDVMIGAASTAVGINMTFLLPYSMLRKGWDRDFRSLAIFDLATGLVIPFTIATGCVVMATATQFHTIPAEGFLGEKDAQGVVVQPAKSLVGGFKSLMDARIKAGMTDEEIAAFTAMPEAEKAEIRDNMPVADKCMAAMLVKRDSFNLADSLAPLLGGGLAKYIFGLGVVAMTLNAATMLMLINGLCLCEMFGKPAKGALQVVGSLIPAIGVLGAFFWNDAKMWLAVPTSVFCAALLPVAYIAFFLLMNQKKFMKDDMPTGLARVIWNVLMSASVVLTAALSFWCLWDKGGLIGDKWLGIGRNAGSCIGLAVFMGFGILVIIVHYVRKGKETG
ncbi:MAG: divalent metal cation transporter [Planctomycetota bacterium]|jgi:Mn2+/Fe2+ NRAMP family transporter